MLSATAVSTAGIQSGAIGGRKKAHAVTLSAKFFFRLFLVILGRKRQLFNFSKGQVAWIAHVAPVRLFSFLGNPSSASATGENLFLQ